MNSFFTSVTAKIMFIGLLILIMIIPVIRIQFLIEERKGRQEEARMEIGENWAKNQTIFGPILIIPYKITWIEKVFNGKDIVGETTKSKTEKAYFLPENLNYKGMIDPIEKNRGIFNVVVYNSKFEMSGLFKPDFKALAVNPENILWNEAVVSLGITDMKGLGSSPVLNWNSTVIPFVPGSETGLISSGIHAQLSETTLKNFDTLNFKFDLDLKGSESVYVLPLGKETKVSLASSWPGPSFDGHFLPTSSTINQSGFEANWNISYFGRGFAQSWQGKDDSNYVDLEQEMRSTAFGVKLLLPVDFYQKNERSVKYAILFIMLTFTAFFLFEILSHLRIHPVQYLLVGFAMCLFYVLLLSLSEHLAFGYSYLAASAATIGLITLYSVSVLKQKGNVAMMTLLLIGIYVYLYFLLQLQDYSLLLGAIFLFLILGLVMFLTRKIDWYSVKMNEKK